MPSSADAPLAEFESPVPLAADESCIHRGSLPGLRDKYQFVNIKLDKTGGLTEALALADAAKKDGLRLMVGCMLGTSLAMAPAALIGQSCEFVDLDGPYLLQRDRDPALQLAADGRMGWNGNLWGG